jgi:hypothetical protein
MGLAIGESDVSGYMGFPLFRQQKELAPGEPWGPAKRVRGHKITYYPLLSGYQVQL